MNVVKYRLLPEAQCRIEYGIFKSAITSVIEPATGTPGLDNDDIVKTLVDSLPIAQILHRAFDHVIVLAC